MNKGVVGKKCVSARFSKYFFNWIFKIFCRSQFSIITMTIPIIFSIEVLLKNPIQGFRYLYYCPKYVFKNLFLPCHNFFGLFQVEKANKYELQGTKRTIFDEKYRVLMWHKSTGWAKTWKDLFIVFN